MNSETRTFYNRFAVFYPIVDLFLRSQKTHMIQKINRLPKGKLLDIGVGNGAHLPLYKRHHITGIDTSPVMLQMASLRNPGRVALFEMNGESLLFEEESFDYVVLSHVIAVVDNPEQLVEEAIRVSKPNGRIFILNHFTPDNGLKYVDQAFSIFSKLFHFKSVFHLAEIRALNRLKKIQELNFGPLSYFKLLVYEKK